MHGAVVGGNFSPIRNFSVKIGKIASKGSNIFGKNRDRKFRQSINSGIKLTHFQ
jgi:hypothetical protein